MEEHPETRILGAKLDGIKEQLDDVKERSAEDRDLADDRHGDTARHLGRIEDQVRLINGRLGRAEEQIKTIFSKIAARVGSVTLKDLTLWASLLGGGYLFLTQVAGYHK